MIQIVIIGSGNLAQHLLKTFNKSNEVDVLQVFSRQKKSLESLIDTTKITDDLADLVKADVYILAVSDDAIAQVSSQLPFENRLVVHTSGAVPLQTLNIKNRNGVFYPLQTFSKNVEIDFKEVPICLETHLESDFIILENLASILSPKIYSIDSRQRKALHVAAVFVNNFTNHLYGIGNQICIENEIPFAILQTLIEETTKKIKTIAPKEAQTGPARRNDIKTIQSHLDFLTDENQKTIYQILTQSIIKNYNEL